MINEVTPKQALEFSHRVLAWHSTHGRHDLPWQSKRTPYRVWVSEIMLQQTQVVTVIPYYQRFIKQLPNIKALATAPQDQVLSLWTGLGYYARARNLHKSAQIIVNEHSGRFPSRSEIVIQLPGIGRSTAGAVLALSRNQRHPILDGNVKRILTRYFAINGWPGHKLTENALWNLADKLTPHDDVADYTQAIMDLGATLCQRRNPSCQHCPIKTGCLAHAQGNPHDYPTIKQKKALPQRQTTMLLLRNHKQQILMVKRPPAGIWGGLWSFPEHETSEDLHTWCQKHLACRLENTETWPTLHHTFSHFHLAINPVHAQTTEIPTIMEGADYAWYNLAATHKLGLAAPIKQLLERLGMST